MKTELLPVTAVSVKRAAALLRAGEIVAFPTETVYGLGANALDAGAVMKIFEAKGRPADNPLIAHVGEIEDARALVQEMPKVAEQLMDAFWPGPLTLILTRAAHVPQAISANLPTLAVRMPAHPAARELILEAGLPIAAPSANRSGKPSPTTARHVLEDLSGRIPLILDGGTCEVGLESTVLDLTGEIPTILRPGGVSPEMLREILPEVRVDDAVLRPLRQGVAPKSPGMKYRHYAPAARVVVVRGEQSAVRARIVELYDASARAMILAASAEGYGNRRVTALGEDVGAMAGRLFSTLRALDAQGEPLILAEATNTAGIGLAYMNRLLRAAGFEVLDV